MDAGLAVQRIRRRARALGALGDRTVGTVALSASLRSALRRSLHFRAVPHAWAIGGEPIRLGSFACQYCAIRCQVLMRELEVKTRLVHRDGRSALTEPLTAATHLPPPTPSTASPSVRPSFRPACYLHVFRRRPTYLPLACPAGAAACRLCCNTSRTSRRLLHRPAVGGPHRCHR